MKDKDQDKKKKRKIFFSIIIVIIIILSITAFIPFTYGDDNNLSIEIELEKSEIKLNDRNNLTVIIKNNGDSSIRLLDLPYIFDLFVFDSNGSVLISIGPDNKLMRPTIFNLMKIKPGETITLTEIFYVLPDTYAINNSYSVVAKLQDLNTDSKRLWLPHWTGEIESNPMEFWIVE